jgi:hypothetical protein
MMPLHAAFIYDHYEKQLPEKELPKQMTHFVLANLNHYDLDKQRGHSL